MKLTLSRASDWVGGVGRPIRQWLQQRSRREQILLLAVGVGLVAWVVWAGVFSPVRDWRENAEIESSAWERRVDWLQSEPRTKTRSELRPGIITSAIGSCGLELLRVNQEGEAILVTLQDQSFACVLDWLSRIESEHGIEVEQLRLQAGQREGGVSGTLRFSG